MPSTCQGTGNEPTQPTHPSVTTGEAHTSRASDPSPDSGTSIASVFAIDKAAAVVINSEHLPTLPSIPLRYANLMTRALRIRMQGQRRTAEEEQILNCCKNLRRCGLANLTAALVDMLLTRLFLRAQTVRAVTQMLTSPVYLARLAELYRMEEKLLDHPCGPLSQNLPIPAHTRANTFLVYLGVLRMAIMEGFMSHQDWEGLLESMFSPVVIPGLSSDVLKLG